MRIFRSREDSLKFGLSFFMIWGAIVGTIFCNGMSAEMKADLHMVEQGMVTSASLSQADFSELFFRLLPRRLWTLLFLFLISATQMAPLLFMAVAGYFGFSTAVLICTLTMDAGILGLWNCFLMVFPQCLFYVPVAYILLWMLPAKGRHLTGLSAAVLAAAVILGVGAESVINPWFLLLL